MALMRTVCALLAVAVAGCAANSGVVPSSKDSFVLSRQGTVGSSGSGNVKADAIGEANQYCLGFHKTAQVIRVEEARRLFVFGNVPKAEVEFKCLDPADPALGQPIPKPSPP